MTKPLLGVFLLVLLTAGPLYSFCQQLVQTPKDLWLVCAQDKQFIGKPLSVLLKEFKPKITVVIPREGNPYRLGHFTFYFASRKVFGKYQRQDKKPIRISMFVQGTFEWKWEERDRSREHYLDWLKEDEERYGHLLIVSIRVGGEYNECDDDLETNL